jgi:uncharacterized membrane protein
LPIVVIGLTILCTALAVNFDLGREVLERVRLQMVADLAAESGACVLSDSLNFLATTNLAMLSLGIAAFFGQGEVIYLIRQLQTTQDLTAQTAGTAALAKAELEATSRGAVAIPLNYLTGSVLPSLMVARGYVGTIPVWLEDRLQTSKEKVAGERFVRLLVRKQTPEPIGEHSASVQYALAEAAATGQRILGEQIIFPLPEPNYKASLVEVKCNPQALP